MPFLLFVLLTAGQGRFGDTSQFWLYLAKTILGVWMLALMWRHVGEMRWAWSWEAVVVGVAVFVAWVGLDGHYPSAEALVRALGLSNASGAASSPDWNPHAHFSQGGLAWFFIAVRFVGSVLVVPPLEEAFYRSFVYRYLAKVDFQSVSLGQFLIGPLLITSAVFGFAHVEWLPGILCGLAYQGLVIRKNRLGDAMTAHAITNLLVGAWVVWKGVWHFW
ncbi:MAG TPA: CAAX prenyl protease-related protein [Verrucomicrobiae bacterium]